VGDEKLIPQLLQECRKHLFVVTLNGADHEGGWDRLIQPLDRGEFDVPGFLVQLRNVGFTGPIGLQHFGVKGDSRENLSRSMLAWRKLVASQTPQAGPTH
jgi:sugar phosphate isomerase/epimerase